MEASNTCKSYIRTESKERIVRIFKFFFSFSFHSEGREVILILCVYVYATFCNVSKFHGCAEVQVSIKV